MLTICTLNFIVTGIQFWISDYFKSKLHESHTRSTIAFLIILIFGPIFGVVFGINIVFLQPNFFN
jgi:hypothetical protein